MRKHKVFLTIEIELDADEVVDLPPHLKSMLSRPLVEPIQTREAKASPGLWFPTEQQKRDKRTRERLERVRKQQAKAIERGELEPPETTAEV